MEKKDDSDLYTSRETVSGAHYQLWLCTVGRTSACRQRIPVDDANHDNAPDAHAKQRPYEAAV